MNIIKKHNLQVFKVEKLKHTVDQSDILLKKVNLKIKSIIVLKNTYKMN